LKSSCFFLSFFLVFVFWRQKQKKQTPRIFRNRKFFLDPPKFASADFFPDVIKYNSFCLPPSLFFLDRIFKSCQSDNLACITRVSSDDLSFGGWLEKASMACLEVIWASNQENLNVRLGCQ